MTSQLNVDTIVDKAGSGGSNVKMANTSTYVAEGGGATQNTVQGLAKVWLSWLYASNTFADSFNVSSGTDDATGQYTYTFTNAMDNANYPGHITLDNNLNQHWLNPRTTTSVRGRMYTGSAYSDQNNFVSINGDLA